MVSFSMLPLNNRPYYCTYLDALKSETSKTHTIYRWRSMAFWQKVSVSAGNAETALDETEVVGTPNL